MYNAFGWQPPKFAHIGLLVDTDRKKLSKRDMSSSLEFYQHRHVLPPALLNFLLFLGWRLPPGRSDIMSLQEMVDNVCGAAPPRCVVSINTSNVLFPPLSSPSSSAKAT